MFKLRFWFSVYFQCLLPVRPDFIYLHCSILPHLPPLRFHCVRGMLAGIESIARICKRSWSPGIYEEESIPPAYVAWRAGQAGWESIPGLLKRSTNTGSGLMLCVGSLSPAMVARNQVGIGLSCRPASLCSLATQFQTRFLESIPRPIAGLKFPTLDALFALADKRSNHSARSHPHVHKVCQESVVTLQNGDCWIF